MNWNSTQRGVLLIVLAALVIGAFFALSQSRVTIVPNEGELTHLTNTLPAPSATISAASTTIIVSIAETKEEHTRGLSGRENLDASTGLLFIFDQPDRYGFWMPDMYFPIDIIWIDADWRIVDIAESVPPDSYPKVFTPTTPALYVLEVNAGKASTWGWKIGTPLVFNR